MPGLVGSLRTFVQQFNAADERSLEEEQVIRWAAEVFGINMIDGLLSEEQERAVLQQMSEMIAQFNLEVGAIRVALADDGRSIFLHCNRFGGWHNAAKELLEKYVKADASATRIRHGLAVVDFAGLEHRWPEPELDLPNLEGLGRDRTCFLRTVVLDAALGSQKDRQNAEQLARYLRVSRVG